MEINNIFLIIALFFLVINLIAFFLMLWDKRESRIRNAERISEGMLFFMATAFGGLGVLAGMYILRHKNRKWYFIVGIPLVMIQNLSFLYLVYVFLAEKMIIRY
jgi:uncharacterized membrane protein YsdA (DUF1294 family)